MTTSSTDSEQIHSHGYQARGQRRHRDVDPRNNLHVMAPNPYVDGLSVQGGDVQMVLGNRRGAFTSGTIQVFSGVTSSKPTTSSSKYSLELNPLGGNITLNTESTQAINYLYYGNHTSTTDQLNQFYLDGRKANADGVFGQLIFRNSSDTGAKYVSIEADRLGNNYGTRLRMITTNTAGTPTCKFSIDPSGFVGIGTALPNSSPFYVNTGSQGATDFRANDQATARTLPYTVTYGDEMYVYQPIPGGPHCDVMIYFDAAYSSGGIYVYCNDQACQPYYTIGTDTPGNIIAVRGGAGERSAIHIKPVSGASIRVTAVAWNPRIKIHSEVENATLQLGAYYETHEAALLFRTPFTTGSYGIAGTAPTKAGIICSGLGVGFSRSNMHFCLDGTASNDGEYNAHISKNARMTIHHNGNVGIGSSNPGSKLQVAGPSNQAGASNATLTFSGDGAYPANGNLPAIYHRAYVGLGLSSDYQMSFEINAASTRTEAMRIRNDGNVGIGTNNPVYPLHVHIPGGAWNDFTIRHTSLWGDGLTTAAEYDGVKYITLAGAMYQNPHVVPATVGGDAYIRYGRAGGISTGTWWQTACHTDGKFRITEQGVAANGITIYNDSSIGHRSAWVRLARTGDYDTTAGTGTVERVIPFDASQGETGLWDATNERYNCPVEGEYIITGNVMGYPQTSVTAYAWIQVRRYNSSGVLQDNGEQLSMRQPLGNSYLEFAFSQGHYAFAGDYFVIYSFVANYAGQSASFNLHAGWGGVSIYLLRRGS
jgi:hypothetical protein